MIAGQVGTGKTSLAVRLAREYSRQGIPVIALDPYLDPRWPPECLIFDDPLTFHRTWPTYHDGMLFVDESGRYVGVNRQSPIESVATQARHFGHTSHFLTQRLAQVDPNVRSQMNHLALFNVTPYDVKTLHQEWGYPEILGANRLGVGEFLWMGRVDEPPQRFRIDPATLNVYHGGLTDGSQTVSTGSRGVAGRSGHGADAAPGQVSRTAQAQNIQ